MHAHDRVVDWRLRPALLVSERLLAVAPVAREIEVMHGPQAGNARFPLRREPLVGAVHVAEMRLAARTALGHHLAVNDRGLSRDALPGTVGVPRERALVGMLAVRAPLFVEVR